MRVRSDSLAVIDKVSENDRRDIEQRMRAEVLESGKYPEIVFRSVSVSSNGTTDAQYQLKISGEIALHGVTSRVLVPAQLSSSGNDLHAHGEFLKLGINISERSISRLMPHISRQSPQGNSIS